MFKAQDTRTLELLAHYRAEDTHDRVLIRHDGGIIQARTREELCHWARLAPTIYHDADPAPHVALRGSVWHNWRFPDFDHAYRVQGDHVVMETHRDHTLSWDHYRARVDRHLRDRLARIYHGRDRVRLAYSGGMDSLVLLAYIRALGWADRTELVWFRNDLMPTVPEPDFHGERSLGLTVSRHRLDRSHLLRAINSGSHARARAWTTWALADRLRDRPLLFGHHGNQLLLHKSVMLEHTQGAIAPDVYCQHMLDHRAASGSRGLPTHNLVIRDWHLLGLPNIHSVLHDGSLFALVRCLDWSGITRQHIANAQLCRELIHNLGQSGLMDLVDTEKPQHSDSVPKDYRVPVREVHDQILRLTPHPRHHPVGLHALQKEIDQSLARGDIAVKTLISCLAVHEFARCESN